MRSPSIPGYPQVPPYDLNFALIGYSPKDTHPIAPCLQGRAFLGCVFVPLVDALDSRLGVSLHRVNHILADAEPLHPG